MSNQTEHQLGSQILHIDSRDASRYFSTKTLTSFDGSTHNVPIVSNFQYVFKQGIDIPDNYVAFLSLHSATIPYSFYNIRQNVNDTLEMKLYTYTAGEWVDRGGQTLTLTEGNYTASTLGSYLETYIPTTDGTTNRWTGYSFTIDFVYNRDEQKYTLKMIQDNMKLEFLFATASFPDKMVNQELGFIARDFSFYNIAGTKTNNQSDLSVDLNGSIHGIYLRTSLTKSVNDSQYKAFGDILARIPINVQSGGIIFYSPSDGSVHQTLFPLNHIQMINIRMTDERNRIIDLNGHNLQLSIQVNFVRKNKLQPLYSTRKRLEGKPKKEEKRLGRPPDRRGRPKKEEPTKINYVR